MDDKPLAARCEQMFYRMRRSPIPRWRVLMPLRLLDMRIRQRTNTLFSPIECLNPATQRLMRTDSSYPEHNGPIDVCDAHVESVRTQNFVNKLVGPGES